ncbi:cysteine-rich secretory protein 2 [Aplysia californica]|uniref:Cysteine-rich secretory protein 2 n=1 Tax=Aplysia californica TaxID=6500 RepID=A0ABM0ZZA3_APLCA|nr:cysteine-rich secretory protein 2 [Aplysia californica]
MAVSAHLTSILRGYHIFFVILTVYFADTMAADCHPKFKRFPGHTACLDKSPLANSVGVNASVKQQIVTMHNHLRAGVTPPATNMLKMTWDDELAMLAQKWTDACSKESGRFHHDSVRDIPGRFPVGQNLMSGGDSFVVAINAWYDEHKNYVFNRTVDHFGPVMIGHYTQLAWAETYKIGCGFTKCDGVPLYICNYAPLGNIFPYKRPYVDGTRCSKCQTCSDGGVCDCGTTECQNGGTLNTATCKCECKPFDFLAKSDCHINCTGGGKDTWYCGTDPNYLLSNCDAPFVSSACPFQCNLCPYVDPNYKGTAPLMIGSWPQALVSAVFASVSLMV